MKNIFYPLMAILVSLLSCKKESDINKTDQPTANLLVGLWKVDFLTITTYDSIGNITSLDTVPYVNNQGDPITLLEEYTINNKFYMFSDTIIDTLESSTYNRTGSIILINIPDSVFAFNNRTITQLDSSKLELFQYYSNHLPHQKLTQTYRRN
jgi:hypothetical protein